LATAAAHATASRQKKLDKLGLKTDWDFLLHLPLRYEDETQITPIADLPVGVEAQAEGTVESCEVVFRGRKQLLARLRDDSGELILRYLNFYPSQQRQLAVGRRVRVYGAARGGLMGTEMVHPRVRVADDDRPLPNRLTPVYPTTEGLPQAWLRARIERALRDVDIRDTLPEPVRARFALGDLAASIRGLHLPAPDDDRLALSEHRHPRWTRIKFDELLAQQISLRTARELRAQQRAPMLAGRAGESSPQEPAASETVATAGDAGSAGAHDARPRDLVARLLSALPFTLTAAQQRVWREVAADLAAGRPMHRLVQGDVGSGKTVIAALAAARAIDCGRQAALMAPTEILAEQHFRRIEQWLAPLGVQVAWLAGKLKPAEKRAAQAAVADGSAQLVVGTHALIQDAVEFRSLALAIVDEQHRFGVAQRLRLRALGTSPPPLAAAGAAPAHGRGAEAGDAEAPHLLMLSATPIPRTLAMSYLADLDVSVIDEMPPGRSPVVTKLVSTARRDEVLARIRGEVAQGRQAYWVCPLVEESDQIDSPVDLTAATVMYEETKKLLPDLRLGLLHGQLPPAEKAAVMQLFADGRIDVLVATTVVEVGVDVPNATLMVIEHAQRFGLAQLHQLRGRVGRGAAQSYCVLLFDEPLSDAARERLKVIYETADGFEVARRDLQLRGPGEFLGARQSGVPLLRFADLERDVALVEQARACAELLLRQHPEAARAHVARWLGRRAQLLDA
jgi:ATP-dependent DNA helicase RecG